MAWLRSALVLALLPSMPLLGACDPMVEPPDDEEDDIAAPDDDEDDDDVADADDPNHSNPPAPARPEAAVSCNPDAWGGNACTTADGQQGTSFCIIEEGGQLDTPCSTEPPECEPAESWDQGCMGEICYWDGEAFRRYSWSEEDCNTPLVVSFDGAPIELTPAIAASFDLSPNGTCMSTDWPTAPWLALDRDGDGLIRDGGELFGNATALTSGGYAEHGFAALAELDSDRDGKITASDERFGELVLWSDLDDDRIGTHAELQPLRETSLVAIDLGVRRRASCDGRGNCGYERTTLEYRTPAGSLGVGEVVDVHLACR